MINGVINVYKEAGFTSHDVVAKLRGILKQKKIGHTGTLDPDAVGVLPVCLGKATKLVSMLTDETKTYEALMHLGLTTDTQDGSGTILQERPVTCSKEDVLACLQDFVGPQMQIPPMYSAKKVGGKKLYELAREGKEVERKAVEVNFLEILPVEIDLPMVRFTVTCSKGTYIRTLCNDMGEKLGCGACMDHLKRIRVGRFAIEDALSLTEIEKLRDEGAIGSCIHTLDEMFEHLPAVSTTNAGDPLAHNGNKIRLDMVRAQVRPESGDQVRVYDSRNVFVGIYTYKKKERLFQPEKMFYDTK